MASSMRCWPNPWLNGVLRWCLFACLAMGVGMTHAQTATEITQVRVERADEDIQLSAQMQFELPPAVEDALTKGIALYFVLDAQILRDRWYWYDKKVAAAERHFRIAFQPLTRRWRVNVTSGPGTSSVGLTLNQSFDSLPEALVAIKRVSRWKIAGSGDIEPGAKHRLELRFRLDLGQLPRPFQIGALGQSDWDINASHNLSLAADMLR